MNWLIGDVITSSKGNKTAPITNVKGEPIFLQLTTPKEPLTAPFGASAYNDPQATRKNICFRCTEELEQTISAIDHYMEAYLKEHSQRLFKGKQMTYKPLLSLKEDYPALLRCKINTVGQRAARFWTPLYTRTDPPVDFKECAISPRAQVRSLWVMGSECGVCLDVCDVMYSIIEDKCPFEATLSA